MEIHAGSSEDHEEEKGEPAPESGFERILEHWRRLPLIQAIGALADDDILSSSPAAKVTLLPRLTLLSEEIKFNFSAPDHGDFRGFIHENAPGLLNATGSSSNVKWEIKLDSVEEKPFGSGGQGSAHRAKFVTHVYDPCELVGSTNRMCMIPVDLSDQPIACV